MPSSGYKYNKMCSLKYKILGGWMTWCAFKDRNILFLTSTVHCEVRMYTSYNTSIIQCIEKHMILLNVVALYMSKEMLKAPAGAFSITFDVY